MAAGLLPNRGADTRRQPCTSGLPNPRRAPALSHPTANVLAYRRIASEVSIARIRHGRPPQLIRSVTPRSENYPDVEPLGSETNDNANRESACRLGRRQLLQTALGGALWAAGSPLPGNAATGPVSDKDIEQRLERAISEFTLPNGMHFIVMQRHRAPIISCHVHANVGAFDEEQGLTGLAHFLEHMMFKGTERIGGLDLGGARESHALDNLDEAFYSLQGATSAGSMRESARLEDQVLHLQQEAEKFVVPNAYGAWVQQNGGANFNATTSHDATKFYVSLPSNRLELWFALEAERFMAPVWRQLYTEKNVVAEERRMRTDNAPMGKYQEDFAKEVFANNYSRPVVGWAGDMARVGRREVADFHARHYTPQNLSVALVGDLDPLQAYNYAVKHFGGWQCAAGSACAMPSQPSEPLARLQGASMRFEQLERAGPAVMKAYYRRGMSHSDGVALDAIRGIMSGSYTSRLHKALVETDEALSASAVSAVPCNKHPSIFMMYANAYEEQGLGKVEASLQLAGTRLAEYGATRPELQKALRMDAMETMGFNSTLAEALATAHALTGSWRTIPATLRRADALTSHDIQEVASRTFSAENCYTAVVLPLRD